MSVSKTNCVKAGGFKKLLLYGATSRTKFVQKKKFKLKKQYLKRKNYFETEKQLKKI